MFISAAAGEWRKAEKTGFWRFVLLLTTLVCLLSTTAVARPLDAASPVVPRGECVVFNPLFYLVVRGACECSSTRLRHAPFDRLSLAPSQVEWGHCRVAQ
jgi:hypothetical protein